MSVREAVLRFPIIGDLEPKPDPVFDNFRKTVDVIKDLGRSMPMDFAASAGDLAHKGTTLQYDIITEILSELKLPLYTIMGNEELRESKERYLSYCSRWHYDGDGTPDVRFIKKWAGIVFLFATAETDGRTFTDAEIEWILNQIDANADSPVVLFTHAPMPDVFPDAAPDRTMQNDLFQAVVKRPNVVVNFSSHTHFDLDVTTSYVEDQNGVHHVHIPGIERTKVGPTHTPRFRFVSVYDDGEIVVQTYNVLTDRFEENHEVRFSIPYHKLTA